MSWENLSMPYANNKGADQPAHLRSLISTFVVHSLDSITPLVSIYMYIWNFKPLASHSSCAGRFESCLVANSQRQVFSWRSSYRDIHKWASSWQNQQNDLCAQWRHPPSLNRVFAVCMKKHSVLSYQLSTRQRLWSDWANAQADLSLRWAHR